MPRRLATIVCLALLLPASATATGSGANGWIVFTSTRDGNEEIYSANVDGSYAKNLTHNTSADLQPAVSPDGTRIAFVSDRNGRRDLFVMNADGSSLTQISDGYYLSVDAEPSWSPDGTQLAFATTRPFNDSWSIWVVNADGTNPHQLSAAFGVSPAWSPDGAQIAYDGGGSIWLMNADGTGAHQLTPGTTTENAPAWSPDGTRLVFGRAPWAGSPYHNLWLINADGSGARQLTSAGTYDGKAAWSPDGTQIVFQRHVFPPFTGTGLYVVRPDTGFVYELDGAGDNYQPDWAVATSPLPPTVKDIAPPTITITRPQEGDVFTLGQVVPADYTCMDAQSGVRHCAGPVPNGQPIDTATTGTKQFLVFASDLVGNVAYRSTSYRVIYAFTGFAAPIANGVLNSLKAGDGAPLKFSLDGNYGLDVLTDASQQPIECAARTATGASAPIGGSLAYNASQDRYQYVWDSDKSWAGTCRSITLTLADGTRHKADFQFTK